MTTTTHRFRCGDTARIDGTDYDIEVSYADYESGRASWRGWPDGCIEIEKLTLVQACSDEEHKVSVARWLDRERGNSADRRRDTIERLYRPIAYRKGVLRICQERFAQAQQALSVATYALRDAQAGPEDA